MTIPRPPFLMILALLLAASCQQLARVNGRIGLERKSLVVNPVNTLNRQFAFPDRRIIGIIHVADSTRITPTNPNGYFWDDEAGMNAFIDRALAVLKSIDAQGIIVWEIEGAKYPAAQYIGSPDLTTYLAPEMAHGVVDRFFARFRAAGLKVGVCLRPTEFNIFTNKHEESADHFATLLRKASWAREGPWKCRLFYVDTNTVHVADWPLLPSTVFARLHKALGDCIFIPEHAKVSGSPYVDFSYYLHCPVYLELRNGDTGTSERIRAEVGDAFSVLNLSGGDIRGNMTRLRESRARGDVMMVDAWWASKEIDDVKELLRPMPTMDFKAEARGRMLRAGGFLQQHTARQ